MDDNNISLIRDSFHNFFGALVDEFGVDNKNAKQQAIAVILEEIMKITTSESEMDIYSLKPVLRLSKNIINYYSSLTPFPLEKEQSYDTIKLIDTVLSRAEKPK